jgi:ParB family chromosome partitioning protein
MSTPQKRTRRSRSKLGRGLSALVDTPQSAKTLVPDAPVEIDLTLPGLDNSPNSRVTEVQIADIHPNKYQPRSMFDDDALESLAASIRETGLMQPILVRARMAGGFEIIAGERRWRACGLAGLETVPAIVREIDDQKSAQWALIENVQREDLNAIEKARGYERLVTIFSMTQQEVATQMGISRVGVTNSIRLLDLDEGIQTMVVDGRLSAGHAKALLQCQDSKRRGQLALRAASEGWTVRTLEHAAGEETPSITGTDASAKSDTRNKRIDSVLTDLEQQLGDYLSTKVTLKADRGGTKGRVQIEFYDLDHFDGLMTQIGFVPNDT